MVIFTLIYITICFSQQKSVIKDYEYNVSDSESLLDARNKTKNILIKSVLEEVTVAVFSKTKQKIIEKNGKVDEYFKNFISSSTAGLVKSKIISETYDGKTLNLKLKVSYDEELIKNKTEQLLKKVIESDSNIYSTESTSELLDKVGKYVFAK